MMKDLIIIGASGFGREVAWLVERINSVDSTWNLLGFLDDDKTKIDKEVNGYRVLGITADCVRFPDAYYACAVGNAKVREKIIKGLRKANEKVRFATLIDPTVEISELVMVGEGAIICAGTIITVNISIGVHVIINLDCTVGHDAVIGDYTTLYPSVNVSGATHIGRCCEMGTGSQMIQGVSIGDNSIIGAGAVVVKDIVEPGTYVGAPARKLY